MAEKEASVPWEVIEWEWNHPPIWRRIIRAVKAIPCRIIGHQMAYDMMTDTIYGSNVSIIYRSCSHCGYSRRVEIDWGKQTAEFEDDPL